MELTTLIFTGCLEKAGLTKSSSWVCRHLLDARMTNGQNWKLYEVINFFKIHKNIGKTRLLHKHRTTQCRDSPKWRLPAFRSLECFISRQATKPFRLSWSRDRCNKRPPRVGFVGSKKTPNGGGTSGISKPDQSSQSSSQANGQGSCTCKDVVAPCTMPYLSIWHCWYVKGHQENKSVYSKMSKANFKTRNNKPRLRQQATNDDTCLLVLQVSNVLLMS